MNNKLSLCGLRDKLLTMEQEEGIRIIHVAECDSRAWGFSTDDSDYDLRYVYVKLPWERKLMETADTRRRKFKIDGLPVDAQGFDLSHLLRKTVQSSFVMYEILHSPLVLARNQMFYPLFEAAFNQYHSKRDMVNYCRGLARKNFEFVVPFDAKHMLHALRLALNAERMHEGNEPILSLPELLAHSTGFAPMVDEIIASRNDQHFVPPEQVTTYLHRICRTDFKGEEPFVKHDAVWFKDIDMVFQYVMRHTCHNFEGMAVDGLSWIDDDPSYYENKD